MTGVAEGYPVSRTGAQSQMKTVMPFQSAAQHCLTVILKHFPLAKANHAAKNNIMGLGGTARHVTKGVARGREELGTIV